MLLRLDSDDVIIVSDSRLDKKIDLGKESAIEAEVKAAKERALIPFEVRVKQFRELLSEKEVIPYLSVYYACVNFTI